MLPYGYKMKVNHKSNYFRHTNKSLTGLKFNLVACHVLYVITSVECNVMFCDWIMQ